MLNKVLTQYFVVWSSVQSKKIRSACYVEWHWYLKLERIVGNIETATGIRRNLDQTQEYDVKLTSSGFE